jgi:hypothetical protein
MSRLLKILEALTLVALILLLGKATIVLNELEPKLANTIENTNRALIAAGAAAGNLEKASEKWEQASQSQSTQTTLAVSHVNAVVEQLSTFITKTDASLNVSLFPALTQAINQQNAGLLTSGQTFSGVLDQAKKVLTDADAQVTNPSINASLANVDAATLETAQAMQNVHAETDLILGQTRKAFAPESRLKSIARMIFTGTLNGAELFYYLTK